MASKRQVLFADTQFVNYKNSTHAFFIGPYSGYIAMNATGRKGCESPVLELLNDLGF